MIGVVLLMGYLAWLVAPIGFLGWQLAAGGSMEEFLHEQLAVFSMVSLVGQSEQNVSHSITFSLNEDTVNAILMSRLQAQQPSFVNFDAPRSEIAPERILLEIPLQFGLLGYYPFTATVFSEWEVRAAEEVSPADIEFRPVTLYTDHFYSANFVTVWEMVSSIDFQHEWIPLSFGSAVQVEDVLLQEHRLDLTVRVGNHDPS